MVVALVFVFGSSDGCAGTEVDNDVDNDDNDEAA